jgi:hypothetical protein
MGIRYCGEFVRRTQMGRRHWIHYNKGLNYGKREVVYIMQACDKNKAPDGEEYTISNDKYNPNSLTSS